MNPRNVTPRDREAIFELDELFFSTTDFKGIITAGNEVFVRVSGWPVDQLVGKAHNIVRHPDMPRAVFSLLWDYLQAGKPIVAYVRNMAADGSYYWVCALATPINGGYLSIRLKPSSDYFPVVRELYGKLRELEAGIESGTGGRKAAIEASRAELDRAIASLGFTDYDEVMQRILVAELSSRRQGLAAAGREPASCTGLALSGNGEIADLMEHCAALHRQVKSMTRDLASFLDLEATLAERAGFVEGLGADLQLMSLNAQIRAAGLANARTLQVVADQMSSSTRSISDSATEIGGTMVEVTRMLREAAFGVAASELSVEMMGLFLSELAVITQGDVAREKRRHLPELAEVVGTNLRGTGEQVLKTRRQIQNFERRLEEFIREIRTLEILHVTGKAEAVQHRQGESISSTFADVHQRALDTRQKLSSLAEVVTRADIQMFDRAALDARIERLMAA